MITDTSTPAAKMMRLIRDTTEEMQGHTTQYRGFDRAVSTLDMSRNMIADLEAELRLLRADKNITIGEHGTEVGLKMRAQMLESAGNTMACHVRNILASNTLFSLVDGERYRLRNLLRDITTQWDSTSGWTAK